LAVHLRVALAQAAGAQRLALGLHLGGRHAARELRLERAPVRLRGAGGRHQREPGDALGVLEVIKESEEATPGVAAQRQTVEAERAADRVEVLDVFAPADRRVARDRRPSAAADRKSTRLNSSHLGISYAVFCLKKKKQKK